jgi:hypothetical protein
MLECFLLPKENSIRLKSKLETTNYQQQETFDLETKRKIQESLQEIYNKQQQQAIKSNDSSRKGKYIKIAYDLEHANLRIKLQHTTHFFQYSCHHIVERVSSISECLQSQIICLRDCNVL